MFHHALLWTASACANKLTDLKPGTNNIKKRTLKDAVFI
jgi:hypothetical protein